MARGLLVDDRHKPIETILPVASMVFIPCLLLAFVRRIKEASTVKKPTATSDCLCKLISISRLWTMTVILFDCINIKLYFQICTCFDENLACLSWSILLFVLSHFVSFLEVRAVKLWTFCLVGRYVSLKLTFKTHLTIDGWKFHEVSFWAKLWSIFRGEEG